MSESNVDYFSGFFCGRRGPVHTVNFGLFILVTHCMGHLVDIRISIEDFGL